MNQPVTAAQALHATQSWVRKVVIGLNLCPFAPPVEEGGRVRYAATEATDKEDIYRFYLAELERLVEADPAELETTLVIVPNALADFDDYLDFLDLAEESIAEADLEGIVQVASFHPAYVFADAAPEDASTYTNRSPYPILHLLREDSLSNALETYPNPESIPERNIQLMQELGIQKIKSLLAEISE